LIAVILAAGKSTRFGCCKQTYLLDGKPVILHAIESIYPLMEINVVVGHEENKVRSVLPNYVSQIIKNQDYENGLGTSVQLAVDCAKAKKEDLLLTLADLAFVNKKDYKKLIKSYSGKAIYSSFGPNYGPPCIIPFHLIERMPKLGKNKGLKSIIKNFDKVSILNASKDIDFKKDIKLYGS